MTILAVVGLVNKRKQNLHYRINQSYVEEDFFDICCAIEMVNKKDLCPAKLKKKQLELTQPRRVMDKDFRRKLTNLVSYSSISELNSIESTESIDFVENHF